MLFHVGGAFFRAANSIQKRKKSSRFVRLYPLNYCTFYPSALYYLGAKKIFWNFLKFFQNFVLILSSSCVVYNERIKQSVTGRQLIHQCLRVGGAVSLFPASPPAPGFITSHFAKQNVRSVRSVPERSQTLGHTRNTETNRLRTHRGTFRSLITDLGSIC